LDMWLWYRGSFRNWAWLGGSAIEFHV